MFCRLSANILFRLIKVDNKPVVIISWISIGHGVANSTKVSRFESNAMN